MKEEESSQVQHYNNIQHQMKVELLETEQQYKRFAMLRPKVYMDGDKWCISYGDMPEGIFGFGDTIHKAVLNWENDFNKQILKK